MGSYIVLQRVGCVGVTVTGLYLTWTGLWETFYIEGTHEAIERADLGRSHMLEGAVLVLVAAGWTIALSRRWWPAALMGIGAVLSSGAAPSWLPWWLLVIAVPLIVTGLVAGVMPATQRRGPAGMVQSPRFTVAIAVTAGLVTLALLVYVAMTLKAILA